MPPSRKRHGQSRLGYLEGEIEKRAVGGGARAEGIEEHTDDKRRSFDAREYASEVAGATLADHREDLDRGIRDIRDSGVGMGRLKSGYGTEDELEFSQDLNRRTSRELARGAFTAASLDLENTGAFASEGIEARRASDDAYTGLRDIEQARANERKKKRSGLLGFLGGVGGAVLGSVIPGVGTALGASLGGKLGASI